MQIIKKKINIIVNLLLPRGYFFDLFYHYLRFLFVNKRIPRKNRFLLNDFLFYTKIDLKITKGKYHFCSDKIELKKYLETKINKENILETISIISNYEGISKFNFEKNQIIKPAHMSGAIIFTNMIENINDIKNEMKDWLNIDYSSIYRENNYKNLNKRIMIEHDLTYNSEVSDLKVFCYRGNVKFFQIDTDRFAHHKRQFLDNNWNIIDVQWQYESLNKKFPKPTFFNKILESCIVIAKDFDFVRIDFLITENNFYCNELTFVPGKAEDRFISIKEETKLSKYLFL